MHEHRPILFGLTHTESGVDTQNNKPAAGVIFKRVVTRASSPLVANATGTNTREMK